MSKKDKKKAGMVLIIGMGVKPKKGKGSLKKQEKRKIKRGGEDSKAARKLKQLNNLRGLDEAGIDEMITRRGLDPEEFHGLVMQQMGKPIDELLDNNKTGTQVIDMLLNESSKSFEARRERREKNADGTVRGIKNITDSARHKSGDRVYNPQVVDEITSKLTPEQKATGGLDDDKFKALLDHAYRESKQRRKQLRGEMYQNYLKRKQGGAYKTPEQKAGMRDDEEARARGDESSTDDEEYNRILRLLQTRRFRNPEETAELSVREGTGRIHIPEREDPDKGNTQGKEIREMRAAPSSFIIGDKLGNFGKPSTPQQEAHTKPDIEGIGYTVKSSPIDAAIALLKQGEDYGDVADALNEMPKNQLDKVRMEQIQRLLGFTPENRVKRAKRDLGLTGGQRGRMERTPSNFSPGAEGDSPRKVAEFSGHPNLASPTGRLPGREPTQDPLASLRMPKYDVGPPRTEGNKKRAVPDPRNSTMD